jgi:hypothetical protein
LLTPIEEDKGASGDTSQIIMRAARIVNSWPSASDGEVVATLVRQGFQNFFRENSEPFNDFPS